MPKQTAGILMYRRRAGGLEVLLVHPGGPFWSRKDEGAWMIPKGGIDPGEDPLEHRCELFDGACMRVGIATIGPLDIAASILG